MNVIPYVIKLNNYYYGCIDEIKFLKLVRVVHCVASFGSLFQEEMVAGKNESLYDRVLSCG